MVKLVISVSALVILLIVLGIMHLVKAAKGPQPTAASPTPEAAGQGDAAAPAPRPARGLTADGKVWGSGLMLTGGIGAFIMAVVLLVPLIMFMGEMRGRDVLPFVLVTDLLGAAAWIMIGIGSLGGVRRTNGYAIVVSIFAWIAALFALAGTVLMNAGGDTGQFFALVGFVAPFVAMLFFAIWGFAGVRGFGLGLGLPMGILGVLGSVAGIMAMMAIADSYRNMRSDAFKLFLIAGVGLSFTSLVLGGIGMVGRLRRRTVSMSS